MVKADGYGHGMIPAARAALAGGAGWLGTADLAEALALRAAGITAPVLCLMAIGEPADAIGAGVDVTAASAAVVTSVAEAAARAGVPARLHLKADTGLSRGGATRADWPGRGRGRPGRPGRRTALQVVGLWSHFACADLPGHPSVAGPAHAFADAAAYAEKAGVTPEVRHIANTAAALTVPESRLDLVRFGGGLYGISTLPGRRAVLAAAGHDAARPAGPGQAGAARLRASPTATATSPIARPRSAWCRSATRTACRARRPAFRWWPRAAAAGPSRARSAWISSSSTSATSR